jgi:FixJ family two-component response regulator
MSGSGATVFVVDDDPAMRESLCWLIESIGLAVRTFPSADAFLAGYDAAAPGCVVLDVRMPGMSGLELAARLADLRSTLPVLLITGHGDVPMAVRALKNGVFDFFEKPFNDQALLERIQQAIDHDAVARQSRRHVEQFEFRLTTLSRRERQVLDLVVVGRLNKQIALELDLSEKTVETHRANAMRKMGAASLVELVRMVVQGKAERPMEA